MNTKKTIRAIVLTAIWLSVCAGLLVLLVAAIGKKKRGHCSDYVITIKGVQNNFFIDEKDVTKIMMNVMGGKIKGQKIADFNLKRLEQLLEDNTWIGDAELYFDNRDVLHVSVNEREPVARVFTMNGNSFYIDSTARRMPLSDKMSARVPVFSGFPDKKVLTKKDSAMLNDMKKTAMFILDNPFWMSQAEQIDIVSCGNNCWQFEMVPTVGNHIVRLGNGDDIEKKFHRLFVFYKEVLSKSGFDKYNTIDVQFAGQVIGSKEKPAKVDSAQLELNIEKLLQEARQATNDNN